MSEPRDLIVVAAIIERDDRFLLTLRRPGTHLADHWEFPGGKCHPAETHRDALRRELHEELDVVAEVGACVFQVTHDYGDRTVSLFFYQCTFEGEPKPMLGQGIAWIARGDLSGLPFPDADRALIERLSSRAASRRSGDRGH